MGSDASALFFRSALFFAAALFFGAALFFAVARRVLEVVIVLNASVRLATKKGLSTAGRNADAISENGLMEWSWAENVTV